MFTIVVIGRDQLVTQYFDQAQVLIGRALDNDIILSDLTVSRRHCLIRAKSQDFVVEDLNSTNSTLLNGYPVSGRATAQARDELIIGAYTIYLLVGRVELGGWFGQSLAQWGTGHSLAPSHAQAQAHVMTWSKERKPEPSATAITERTKLGHARDLACGPTRASLRWLINQVLVGPSDLDAFCLDYFPQVRVRFESSLDRVSKVTLLLERVHPLEILRRLRHEYPELVEQYQDHLSYEDC